MRDPRRVFLAVLVVLAVAACSTTSSPPAETTVVGVVIAVDSAGLADVRGFTIRTDDGRSLTFVLGQLENGAEFPPGHLGEHLASSEPVRVWFHEEVGGSVAYRIEDAGE
jgi:hypothetical protein